MKYVKEHAKSTLMGMTKSDLAEMVILAEQNANNAYDALDQQAKNIKDWKPTITARWLRRMPPLGAGDPLSCCSHCWKTADAETPFCPFCGATMEGKNEA